MGESGKGGTPSHQGFQDTKSYIYIYVTYMSWSFTTWMMVMGPIFGQQSRAPSTALNLGREAASGSDPHRT